MSSPVPLRTAALALQLSALIFAAPAVAQTPAGQATSETREQLTERARVADSLGYKQEAFVLRSRLRDGDFEVGDAVLVKYEGAGLARDDSLTVQSGRILRLGEPLGDLSVSGVLRFEIQDLIKRRVDSLFKNEVVHVTPLMRLAVSGAVRTPGSYQVRPDAPLSNVIMRNVAATDAADLNNIVIRRGAQTLWGASDVKSAITNGLTVNGLNLEPGDELVVQTRKASRWSAYTSAAVTVLTSVLVTLIVRNR